MGDFRDRLTAALADGSLTAVQRRRLARRLRAEAIRDAFPTLPYVFDDGDINIVIIEARLMPAFDAVEFTLAASRNGFSINLDNPFRFINPPTAVRDDAGDISQTNPKTNQVTKFRDDPFAALHEMIADAVRAQA